MHVSRIHWEYRNSLKITSSVAESDNQIDEKLFQRNSHVT